MQPTVMPAWKLTADCIWNTFRISGKKHLFLTGTRNAGKTTLLGKLIPDGLPGLTTWAVPGEGVYLSENGTNIRTAIGVFDPQAVPPMKAKPEGFRGPGIAALRRCAEAESPWISIDEIGFLETVCPEYQAMLCTLLEQKQVLAVIRKQELPFLTALLSRDDAFVLDLDNPFGHTGCVIMASGLGQRFGGNKLMADFGGVPLISGVLSAVECIPHLAVVTRHPDVEAYCRERGIPTVLHDLPYRSDTVRLGLEALPDVDRCLFCPGDQPLLTEQTILSLALLGNILPDRILRPEAEGRPGAPILFPKDLLPELRTLPQGKGGNYLAKKYPGRVICFPIRDPWELEDADTPEALAALFRRKSSL